MAFFAVVITNKTNSFLNAAVDCSKFIFAKTADKVKTSVPWKVSFINSINLGTIIDQNCSVRELWHKWLVFIFCTIMCVTDILPTNIIHKNCDSLVFLWKFNEILKIISPINKQISVAAIRSQTNARELLLIIQLYYWWEYCYALRFQPKNFGKSNYSLWFTATCTIILLMCVSI